MTSRWDTTENRRRARYYALTPAGRRALTQERQSWARISRAVNLVLAVESAARWITHPAACRERLFGLLGRRDPIIHGVTNQSSREE